jgi:hypothetical protein
VDINTLYNIAKIHPINLEELYVNLDHFIAIISIQVRTIGINHKKYKNI